MKNHKCYSESGWWLTLCGLDAANQGFGWSSKRDNVGCEGCIELLSCFDIVPRLRADYMGSVHRKRAKEYLLRSGRGMKT